MIKKFVLLFLCLSWLQTQAEEIKTGPITDFEIGAENMVSGRQGSLYMRSVRIEDQEAFKHFLTQLEEGPHNPSAALLVLDTHVSRRADQGNLYHMMMFLSSEDEETPLAAIIQGPMPVFGQVGYCPEKHKAIIQKLRDLGVRQSIGKGESAHDERVENFGLLSLTPLIRSDIDEETRLDIYESMINLAETLKSQGKRMPVEKNHEHQYVDAALPKHIVMALHPKFRDISLLETLGFIIDYQPDFARFYGVPRVLATYDLAN